MSSELPSDVGKKYMKLGRVVHETHNIFYDDECIDSVIETNDRTIVCSKTGHDIFYDTCKSVVKDVEDESVINPVIVYQYSVDKTCKACNTRLIKVDKDTKCSCVYPTSGIPIYDIIHVRGCSGFDERTGKCSKIDYCVHSCCNGVLPLDVTSVYRATCYVFTTGLDLALSREQSRREKKGIAKLSNVIVRGNKLAYSSHDGDKYIPNVQYLKSVPIGTDNKVPVDCHSSLHRYMEGTCSNVISWRKSVRTVTCGWCSHVQESEDNVCFGMIVFGDAPSRDERWMFIVDMFCTQCK